MSKILSYIMRNLGELVNVVEAAIRLAASIASLTGTPKDDSVIDTIKKGFRKIKKLLEIESGK